MHDQPAEPTQIDDPVEQAVFGACADDRTANAVRLDHAKPGADAATQGTPTDDVNAPPTPFTLAVYGLIVLLGALAGLGPLAIDTYLPSFSAIASDLNSTIPAVGRSLAAYFVGLAVGQLFYGPAADRYGRKRPLYIGLVVFSLASVGCALSTSVPMLVAMRCLQALGGCAEMVIARAIVRDRFPPRDAIRVFSGLVLVMGVAPIVAPLLGGWLLEVSGWRSIFWTLAGVSLLILLMVWKLLPESLPVERRQPLSVGGTLTSFGRLLRDRSFMAYTFVASLLSAGLFAYVGGSPFVFMELHGIDARHFGWFFGANAAGLIGASQINGYLVRIGADPRRILTAALSVATISGLVMVANAFTGVGGFALLYATIFVCLGSCGFIFPNATVLAMAPHGKQAGNASALLGCLQFGMSGLGGFAVSIVHATSAVPMALTIAGCVAAALIIQLTMMRPRASQA